jgi:hypothetical protein
MSEFLKDIDPKESVILKSKPAIGATSINQNYSRTQFLDATCISNACYAVGDQTMAPTMFYKRTRISKEISNQVWVAQNLPILQFKF